MECEQTPKHETQTNRKKKYPVETLSRKKVEQRTTPKEQTPNKAKGQRKRNKADEGVLRKGTRTQREGTLTRNWGRIKRRLGSWTRSQFGNLRTCLKSSVTVT